jgi:hypothetical protein
MLADDLKKNVSRATRKRAQATIRKIANEMRAPSAKTKPKVSARTRRPVRGKQ